MKRLALACLSSCVTTAIVACSGTSTVASSPNSTPKVPVTPSSGPSGLSSPTTTPSEKNVAAVATSYYRAVAVQNYRLAFTYLAPNATGPDGHRLTFQTFLQHAPPLHTLPGPAPTFSFPSLYSPTLNTPQRLK